MSLLRKSTLAGGPIGLVLAVAVFAMSDAGAAAFGKLWQPHCRPEWPQVVVDDEHLGEVGGTWYWSRSPDEEKRVVIGLYNRYCIRCHGVDGRGVWDIPDVPNFTNVRWQASRSDAQLVRLTLEGRGAVMPPFRGALSLEEAWAMARYLRTFIPGSETPRPDLNQPEKPAAPQPAAEPKKATPPKNK
jgi:mono/diheme cytochrome c family protein